MSNLLNTLGENVGWSNVMWAVLFISFFMGTTINNVTDNIFGGEREYVALKADMRGMACMIVSMQEGRDGRYCEFFMSEDTRQLLNEMRTRNGQIGNMEPVHRPPDAEHRVRDWPWLGTAYVSRRYFDERS